MAAASPASSYGNARKPVFVGIDFGTTFSGLSYVIDDMSKIETMPWNIDYKFKFPSRVVYSNGTVSCDPSNSDTEESIEWFKLSLLHPDDLDDGIRKSSIFKRHKKTRRELGLTAEQVAGHFFGHMWSEFCCHLQDSNPSEKYTFFLTIAVPASWPALSHCSVLNAVKLSGIEVKLQAPVQFVTEPEATILGSITKSAKILGSNVPRPWAKLDFELGDTVLVCDCGGGTVDLGGYTISSLNPPILNECIQAVGKFNGTLKIDDRFIDLLDRKVQHVHTHRGFESQKGEYFRRFARDVWETDMKQNFGTEGAIWKHDVPGRWLASGARPRQKNYPVLEFTNEDLSWVFEPVQEIAQLVEDQLHQVLKKGSKAPKYVLLSGGFGLNPFLQRIILQRVNQVSEAIGHQIQTVSFTDRISLCAVSQGAAQRCFQSHTSDPGLATSNVQIDGHVARATYGIRSPVEDKKFEWLCSEGEPLSATRPQLHNLDLSACEVKLGSDGKVVLDLDVFSQKGGGPPQLFSRVTWKSGMAADVFEREPGAVQVQLFFDGIKLKLGFCYRNVQQSDENVTVQHPFVG